MEIIFIFYAYGLYKLLKHVQNDYVHFLLIFALIPVPVFLYNLVNLTAVLEAAGNFALDDIALYLKLGRNGSAIAAIFFGLWLFPLGYLVYKSNFLPKWIGLLLMIGSPGYVISFFQVYLFPDLALSLWSNPILLITHISELSLMIWLLVKGVDLIRWEKSLKV